MNIKGSNSPPSNKNSANAGLSSAIGNTGMDFIALIRSEAARGASITGCANDAIPFVQHSLLAHLIVLFSKRHHARQLHFSVTQREAESAALAFC
jgi:hypothetical protein